MGDAWVWVIWHEGNMDMPDRGRALSDMEGGHGNVAMASVPFHIAGFKQFQALVSFLFRPSDLQTFRH